MVIKILLILAALVAVILLIAAFKSPDFSVTRRATMAAAPAVVFPYVNDFRQWKAWSPWEKMDPNARNTLGGTPGAVGSTFTWDGNNAVGAGKMTLEESRPAERIRIKLEFYKPMAGVCTADYTFQPQDGGTVVTWTMSGKSNLIGRVVCLFMNQDKMIGSQFEAGLAEIKRLAEARK